MKWNEIIYLMTIHICKINKNTMKSNLEQQNELKSHLDVKIPKTEQ